jgi:hypothetical protein
MRWRVDQIMYWKENGRVVVQVDLFDLRGQLRHEKFYRPTASYEQALEAVALELAERGIEGTPRVRQRSGNSLQTQLPLQTRFHQWLKQYASLH